jgi:hypothetical protein
MLLIITNSLDATADYLVSVLDRHGVGFLRFDTDSCISRSKFSYEDGQPLLRFADKLYRPDDLTNVWYRRPERLKQEGIDESPEGKLVLDEWAEALEGFFAHIPLASWMNHPSCNVAASHKIEQLTRAPSLGFLVPDTLVTQDAEALRRFYARHNGQVIVKPMSGGRVERPEGQTDTLIYTNQVVPDQLENLDDLPSCPTLFQQSIEKTCDVRITVVGQDVHAVELTAKELDGSQRCDIRRNNMNDVTYRIVTLPSDVVTSVKRLMAHYNLRYAAIDMAIGTDGRWYFFEVNPNGQWAWMDLAGVTNVAVSFVREFGD